MKEGKMIEKKNISRNIENIFHEDKSKDTEKINKNHLFCCKSKTHPRTSKRNEMFRRFFEEGSNEDIHTDE